MNRYTYRAQWLPDYNEYLGVCIELPYMRRDAPTAPQAVAAIEQGVPMNQWIVQKLSGGAPSETFGLSGYD